MSVNTTADEKLAAAKEHIHAAMNDLAAIVVEKCHGHDEYSQETYGNLRQAFLTLFELDKLLN